MLEQTFVIRDETVLRRLGTVIRANWLAMAQANKPMAVTIAEAKAKRSGSQNKRYWALLNEIAASAWVNGRQYSADAWHAEFAGRLIGFDETPSGARVPISTTTLNVHEFGDYMTKIELIAADELGVEIGETA